MLFLTGESGREGRVAPGGCLARSTVSCAPRRRALARPPLADHPPWPLSRADLSPLDAVLQTETFEDYVEGTDPGIRRFRILYKKP